jgi:hypothetical protein
MIDPPGIDTFSALQKPLHLDLTVNVTKSVRLSLAATIESDPQDTTLAQQVWRDVATAQGELLTWLLAPATQTALRSMQN